MGEEEKYVCNTAVFDEDEVCRLTSANKYVYGLVVESSEYLSSDEDDDETPGRLHRGTVRVAWHPDGKETVVDESKIVLTDRSLMPGDVVRRMIKNSQRGFVQDLDVRCHVHILGTDKYIYNVDTKHLFSSQEFDPEPGEVTLDSWVGRIKSIHEEFRLSLPDGAVCTLTDDDISMLEDVNEKREKYSTFAGRDFYYKGQIVKGNLEDLSYAKWVHSTPNFNNKTVHSSSASIQNVYARIEEVTVTSLDVNWLCRGFAKVDNPHMKMESPSHSVKKSDLKRIEMLDLFNYCNKQIGDNAFYVIKDSDVLVDTPPKKTLIPDIVVHQKPNPEILPAHNLEQINGDIYMEHGENVDKIRKNLKEDIDKIKVNGDIDEQEHNESESRTNSENQSESRTSDGNEGNLHNVNGYASCSPDTSDEKCTGANDDEEYEDIDDSDKDSECSSVASSQSGTVNPSKKKKKSNKKGLALKTKQLKKMKGSKRTLKFDDKVLECKPGDKVPVEIAYTYSVACVMWQNGEVQSDIPSPELFPIHHLDELEFFPGDFIVDSKESSESHDYGVVLSCDHQERTCMVKWMKTVDLSKGERPDESVVPEEVSVYDIKDHPDFKFRPGHTVIRVGEPPNVTDDTPAVGQIQRLDPHGSMYIKWPGVTEVSRCYPQELYIVGDEMSEFDSSSDSSEWETEEEEDESDSEWETENEEEMNEDKSDQDEDSDSNIQCKSSDVDKLFLLGKSKKEELDGLLERAQTALRKLEEIFQNFEGKLQNSFQCYQDIITIYRKCRDLEKILKSNYFEDSDIVDSIDEIKRELRKEKSKKINKHLLEVYETRKTQGQKAKDKCSDISELSGQLEKVGLLEGDVNIESGNAACASSSHDIEGAGCGVKSDSSVELIGAQKRASDSDIVFVDGCDNQVSSSVEAVCDIDKNDEDKCLSNEVESEISCMSTDRGLDKASSSKELTKPKGATGNDNQDGGASSKGDKSEKPRRTSASGRSKSESDDVINKELCLKICKQLHIGMTKIQQEMEKRWKKAEKSLGSQADGASSSVNSIEKSKESIEQKSSTECVMDDNSVGIEAENKTNELPKVENDVSMDTVSAEGVEAENKTSELSKVENDVSMDTENVNATLDDDNVEICKNVVAMDTEFESASVAAGDTTMESDGNDNVDNSCHDDSNENDNVDNSCRDGDKEKGDIVVKHEKVAEYTDNCVAIDESCKGFHLLEEVPSCHKFKPVEQTTDSKTFMSAVMKELKLLQTTLPEGIVVKGFEDRMDLYSVMIVGPAKTPYEDGLFFFEVRLSSDYPNQPPEFHYISYCSDRLNPNLYDDGKVCVSLLGTWGGKGNEVWTQNSNLLQVLVSIQGLILVDEPYYNEAGYEKQRGTQQGHENSKMYNEMAILKMIQSLNCMVKNPPSVFKDEVKEYQHKRWPRLIQRLENWVSKSSQPSLSPGGSIASNLESNQNKNHDEKHSVDSDDNCSHDIPEFPLLPASRGFCLTLKKQLELFRKTLDESTS